MFEILHHWAINGITASCHQLRLSAGDSVGIDCELFQVDEAKNSLSSADELAQKQIDFSLVGNKALLVTRCHIVLFGRIPYLLSAGFNDPVYATEATAHLLLLV